MCIKSLVQLIIKNLLSNIMRYLHSGLYNFISQFKKGNFRLDLHLLVKDHQKGKEKECLTMRLSLKNLKKSIAFADSPRTTGV